ncbi:type VI secretion system accessory protein TagJ [Algicella marina]|uniref:Virulence protein SciE type n=1 Tax=Algicella marina TaxID=2683284 RepID=A0A6P1T458_9RHOB|nr:type VI secretion system accessory protein TagJ [Algicella marina]QHQ36551.1 virulence protein SciE type [Algicella marina]
MSAEELLRNGDLSGALAELQNTVRSDPSAAKHRIFLSQLLCVLGDWQRAVAQLKVSAELDALAIPMAQTYREGIICEVYREKVFAGEKEPLIFGEPQEWVALLIEALKTLAAGKTETVAELRDKAFEAAPIVSGTLNGQPFEWLADADTRLGPLFEMVINGRYFWVPMDQLTKITLTEPEDLRDSVWMPANVTLANSSDIVALIPTRYAGTATTGSDAAKLSRSTEWQDLGGETFVGIGQRMMATEAGDFPLMDIREITFDGPASNG